QIHERDAGIHRTMLDMDPIDDDVWQGGVGGSEKYSNITRYPNSAEVLVSTHAKVDRLMLQMKVQKNSLDEIYAAATRRADYFASVPSIKPVNENLLQRNLNAMSGFGI